MSDMDVTDAQIDAALTVLIEEGMQLPYGANVAYYVSADSEGEERARQLAALKAADEEADAKNREVVRRALQAAVDARSNEESS